MKFRDVIKMMDADGWYLVRTNGSHRIYQHPVSPEAFPFRSIVSETMCPPA